MANRLCAVPASDFGAVPARATGVAARGSVAPHVRFRADFGRAGQRDHAMLIPLVIAVVVGLRQLAVAIRRFERRTHMRTGSRPKPAMSSRPAVSPVRSRSTTQLTPEPTFKTLARRDFGWRRSEAVNQVLCGRTLRPGLLRVDTAAKAPHPGRSAPALRRHGRQGRRRRDGAIALSHHRQT